MATVEREGSGGDGVAGDVESLVDLLDLEPLEYNIYRGQNRDIGTGRIYGGQVLAQSLVAAARTVEADRPAHSLHGYFILPGDLEIPVVYFVDRLRDGGSFTTRRVTAIQHGRAIYNMSASFHRREEGLAHQLVEWFVEQGIPIGNGQRAVRVFQQGGIGLEPASARFARQLVLRKLPLDAPMHTPFPADDPAVRPADRNGLRGAAIQPAGQGLTPTRRAWRRARGRARPRWRSACSSASSPS